MCRIQLLNPDQKGHEAEALETRLRQLVIGQDDAIAKIVAAYQAFRTGQTPGFNSATVFDPMVGRCISAPDDGKCRIGSANDAGRMPNLFIRNEKCSGLQHATSQGEG